MASPARQGKHHLEGAVPKPQGSPCSRRSANTRYTMNPRSTHTATNGRRDSFPQRVTPPITHSHLPYHPFPKRNLTNPSALTQFPCGRVKRFLKNNTQNKMRVGAKGTFPTPPCSHPTNQLPPLHHSRRLRNRRPRIPDRRSPRAGRQRGQRPESQAHHAPPPAARDPWRRGAGYVDPSHHRVWRCAAAYQSGAAVEGGAEEEGEGGLVCGGSGDFLFLVEMGWVRVGGF